MNLLYHIVFCVVTIFILVKTIFYGVYEIRTEKNKSGGIAVICFSVLVVVFANVVVLMK